MDDTPNNQEPPPTGRAKGYSNLKPAKKGEVRNPKGRIKGSKDRAVIIREILKLHINPKNRTFKRFFDALPENEQQYVKSVQDMIVFGQAVSAMGGNTSAAKWLWDNVYGKQDQNLTIKNVDVTQLSDEELDRIIAGEGIAGEGEAGA